MKSTLLKSLLVVVFILPTMVMGQLNPFSEFNRIMQAGKDAGEIGGAYIAPVLYGFGTNINSGWYNTAEVHKSGRFDLTVNVLPLTFVPSADKSFDATKLNLQEVKLQNGSSSNAATISGSSDDPRSNFVLYNSSNTDSIVITSPQGVGLPLVTSIAAFNLGVGIYKGTEINVRYFPTVGGSGAKIGMLGFGFKHDIKQWIPGISALPFDWAIQGAYTNLNASYDLDGNNDGAKYSDQLLELNSNAYTFNTIVSKKLSVLTLWGSLGYQTSKTNFKASGTYSIEGYNSLGVKENFDITNPIDKTVSGINTPTAAAGFRLKFFVFTTSVGFVYSKYSTANFNLGVCVDFL